MPLSQQNAQQANAKCPPVGYLVFDIETDGLFVDDVPPPVLCAATLEVQGAGTTHEALHPIRTWPVNWTDPSKLPQVAPRAMNIDEICDLVEFMWDRCGWIANPANRLRVCGWNVLGFDLKVLAAHCAKHPEGSRAHTCFTALQCMAWDCWDPMFNFFMGNGYPVSLSAVSDTLDHPVSKTASGAAVAAEWLDQNKPNIKRLEVLHYCANDVLMTALVSTKIAENKSFSWVAKSGKTRSWESKVRTPDAVREHQSKLVAPVCLASTWKFPDNSWMNKGPRKRPRDIPREIQHAAGKLLTQHANVTEVSSTQSVAEVTAVERELPKPSNYLSWLH